MRMINPENPLPKLKKIEHPEVSGFTFIRDENDQTNHTEQHTEESVWVAC